MTNETGDLSLKQLFNKVLNSAEDAINTTAKVTIDNMDINAEMSEATGTDYYVTTTNLGNGVLTISFDDASSYTVAGALALQDIVKVENKTNGWIYVTKGATVTDTSIALVAANQETGYPVCGASDEFEIVYRGIDRLNTVNTNLGTIETDIEATNVLLGTIDADTSIISSDTTSIDAKTPSLGTAAMVASSPVTIATDDTQFSALNTSTDNIESYTSRLLSSANTYAAGATLATTSLGVGGQYNATPITLTDTQSSAVQLDINGHIKVAGYDSSTESIKTTETNPLSEQYTTAIDLLGGTPVELGSTFIDCGAEVQSSGYNTITFWANVDINSSTNPRFKIMAKPIYGGAVEVPLSSASVTIHTDNTYTAASASRYFELNDDADQWVQIDIDLNNTIAGIQLMVSDSNDSDGQIDNLYVVLGY